MRRRVVTMGLVAVCCLAACTPGGAETPTPSPSTTVPSVSPPASVSPTPTATPTPETDRQKAVAEAIRTFEEFLRQTDLVAQKGGADTLPAALASLTTGPQTQQSLNDAREIKVGGLRSTGFGKFTNAASEGVTTSSGRVPTVVLTGCIDQSSVVVTKNGKPYTKKPDYVHVTKAQMERRPGGWRVFVWAGDVVPEGFTCANYS